MKLKHNSSFLPLLVGMFFLTSQTGEASKQPYTSKQVYVSDDEYDVAQHQAIKRNFGIRTNSNSAVPKADVKLSTTHKNLNEFNVCEDGSTGSKSDDVDVDKTYGVNRNDKGFGSLYDAKIFINDLENYEAFSDPYLEERGELLDIASEIKKLETSKRYPELVKKLKANLQKDLNDFLCKNLPKQKLPYGRALVFQDAGDKHEWFGLVTSGFRKKWTLLKPDGEVDGDVSIEESPETLEPEIVFRCRKAHNQLKSTDWTYIPPETQTVIKKIRSFKKHLAASEELQKFKRAAYIESGSSVEKEGGWEFQGFYEIESKIEYDAESTMYRIKWNDQVLKDNLKHESDLIAGDLEIGDQVFFDQGENSVFGSVTKKLASGYRVKQDADLNEEVSDKIYTLASDKVYLWEKRNPTEEEKNVEHCEEDFSEEFFEKIADVLNTNDKSNFKADFIREKITNHVSEEESIYMGVHPREFMTSDEINEVITWARQSREQKNCKKPTDDIVKMEILNVWKNKMKKKERRADNLSVAVAQKIWNHKIKIKVLGPKTYEPRAQFSISWREMPNKAENGKYNNEFLPYKKENFGIGGNEEGKDSCKEKSDETIAIKLQKEINADITSNDEELANTSNKTENENVEYCFNENGNTCKRKRNLEK